MISIHFGEKLAYIIGMFAAMAVSRYFGDNHAILVVGFIFVTSELVNIRMES